MTVLDFTFPLVIPSRLPAYVMVPPIFRVDFPHLVNPLWNALTACPKVYFINLLGASQSNEVHNQY
jgi:hypothetical protein